MRELSVCVAHIALPALSLSFDRSLPALCAVSVILYSCLALQITWSLWVVSLQCEVSQSIVDVMYILYSISVHFTVLVNSAGLQCQCIVYNYDRIAADFALFIHLDIGNRGCICNSSCYKASCNKYCTTQLHVTVIVSYNE